MKTVGIIGFGSFGRFLAEQLDTRCNVKVFSASGKTSRWGAQLAEVAKSDFLIPAVPLEAYPELLKKLHPLLGNNTVIVDVASVKTKPVACVKELLPGRALVSTHPLFGPESAADSLKGHTLVLCTENSDGPAYATIKAFARSLDLEVIEMSEQAHDREMAMVQGLTFFIAHSLKDMKLHDQRLSTPSFQKLLKLAELEKHHSDELFRTIQTGNPYTKEVRESFMRHARQLDKSIE